MFKYPFPGWDKLAWCVVLVAAMTLEAIGLARSSEATLSALIRATIPIWARAMLAGWLTYHFVIHQ